jgi:hypothetical protein
MWRRDGVYMAKKVAHPSGCLPRGEDVTWDSHDEADDVITATGRDRTIDHSGLTA